MPRGARSFSAGALLFGGRAPFRRGTTLPLRPMAGAAWNFPRGAVFFILFYRMPFSSLQIRREIIQAGGDRRRRVGDGKEGDLLRARFAA